MGNLKLKIKIFYDFDLEEYVCIIDGVSDLEGRGISEKEAYEQFQINYERKLNE